MTVLSYYPGCSLKTSSRFYETSIRQVFAPFGIEMKEIADWSCCGASAAHTVDETLAYALVARNLSLAEEEGHHFFAPCSACYNRSKLTNHAMRYDESVRTRVNDVIHPRRCLGTVDVKNIIEVMHDHIGLERLAKAKKHDLSGIKVAPYYGCVLTRMMRVQPFDDKEDPLSMDTLLWSSGMELVKWPFKMECCGASKTLTNKEMTLRLSNRIMDMAISVGADTIVTPCPLCQMNLDLLPSLGREKESLPVLFLTEAFELALSGTLAGSSSHMISTEGLMKKVKKAEAEEQK